MQSNLVRELKLVHLRGERVKGLCHATRVIEEEEGVAIVVFIGGRVFVENKEEEGGV